ncbi:hypothetical protein [Pseudoalteromonas marina]|jgi:hypothetical protein|uniref:hypothetical protein n=1 Tax=Pseudoalteromonas marina TaxID=267375 RepID=UPI0023F08CB5|nr:hypothetical protein [Pseudoalteromonas marina]
MKLALIVGLMLFLFSQKVFSDDVITYYLDDKESVNNIEHIVSGKVIKVFTLPDENSCFSYAYQLQIEQSFKGKFNVGDIVTVGLNVNSIDVFDSQSQLIFLRKKSKWMDKNCNSEPLNQENNSFITTGYAIGVYERYTFPDGFEVARAKACLSKPVILAGVLSQVDSIKSCNIYLGSYRSLISKIKKLVHSK